MQIQLSENEKQYAIDNYYYMTSSQLAKDLHCSRSSILKIWMDNNLHGKDKARKYYCNFNYFNQIDNEDKSYIIGLIASDGCLYRRKGQQGIFKISLQLLDKYILENILKKFKGNQMLNYTKKTVHYQLVQMIYIMIY